MELHPFSLAREVLSDFSDVVGIAVELGLSPIYCKQAPLNKLKKTSFHRIEKKISLELLCNILKKELCLFFLKKINKN